MKQYTRAFLLLLWVLVGPLQAEPDSAILPGTVPLKISEPLDEVMVSGISRFALRALNESPAQREAKWTRDYSSPEEYIASVAENRDRFRTIIGAVDARLPANGFEIVAKLGQSGIVGRSEHFLIYAVRWPVLPGVNGEGLLLEPRQPAVARVVALPDADWTPEMFVGLSPGLEKHSPIPARLAATGIQVLVPTLISRGMEFSGTPTVAFTNQPHREFIYRQAFPLGRHPIGYEVEKVEAAIDQFERLNQHGNADLPIGVIGVGEGGLIALYSAALDPRIDVAMVSGYFQTRSGIWQEPIYRNVWGLLTEFGDAEIASLIAPRRLVIEACIVPEVVGPSPPTAGRRGGAAPGRIKAIQLTDVRSEYERAAKHFEQLGLENHIKLVPSDSGKGPSGSESALAAFARGLGINNNIANIQTLLEGTTEFVDSGERQRRLVQELTDYTQKLLRLSSNVRDAFWSRANRSSTAKWEESVKFYRDYISKELIGELPSPTIPPNVRSRRVLDEANFTAYEIALDVYPDVIAAGILLVPKNAAATEKRPVVICQHGLEGTPRDTLSRSGEGYRYYKAFAAELAERGFIVYAPQNPYRGEDRFRVIQRQSNPMKRSLFSYIIRQHERTLQWLQTLPFVDADRIGFYGLSYGGKTAMRVPPILHDKYAVCICSADFNDWVRKMASTEDVYSYVFTGEYEMPEWNLGHIASYAELASLLTPQPFMVERGHDDGVAPDEWVAAEFAKVRRHYAKLGIGDRVEIEFFDGPHTIHGVKSFEFLHKHLNFPPSTELGP